ncbi:MAG: hypothetical protein WD716_00220 [Fimbriimonadaceae bacterium]
MDTERPPTLHQLIKARLDIVREDLDEAVARISDDMLPWAPAPGMRTIKGQLEEIAAPRSKSSRGCARACRSLTRRR